MSLSSATASSRARQHSRASASERASEPRPARREQAARSQLSARGFSAAEVDLLLAGPLRVAPRSSAPAVVGLERNRGEDVGGEEEEECARAGAGERVMHNYDDIVFRMNRPSAHRLADQALTMSDEHRAELLAHQAQLVDVQQQQKLQPAPTDTDNADAAVLLPLPLRARRLARCTATEQLPAALPPSLTSEPNQESASLWADARAIDDTLVDVRSQLRALCQPQASPTSLAAREEAGDDTRFEISEGAADPDDSELAAQDALADQATHECLSGSGVPSSCSTTHSCASTCSGSDELHHETDELAEDQTSEGRIVVYSQVRTSEGEVTEGRRLIEQASAWLEAYAEQTTVADRQAEPKLQDVQSQQRATLPVHPVRDAIGRWLIPDGLGRLERPSQSCGAGRVAGFGGADWRMAHEAEDAAEDERVAAGDLACARLSSATPAADSAGAALTRPERTPAWQFARD